MSTSSQSLPSQPTFTVLCEDRWQVYHRLQELNITAQCQGFRALEASVETPTEAIQLWSIVRRISLSRAELANILEERWRDLSFVDHPQEEKI